MNPTNEMQEKFNVILSQRIKIANNSSGYELLVVLSSRPRNSVDIPSLLL